MYLQYAKYQKGAENVAKFRMVHTEFWNDPKVVEEMTSEDKYFYLYLLTNPNTTQIGIYQITKKQMAFEIGYSPESVNALLDRFINHHKLIAYNNETRELAIKNWGKYNFMNGGKPVLDCARAQLKNVKDVSLIRFVGDRIGNEKIKAIYDSYTLRENQKKEHHDDDTLTTRKPIDDEDVKKCKILLNQRFDDTSTIGGQEKEKEKEEEKENNNNHYASAIDFYQQNFGVISPFISECILHWENDLNSELVVEALKRALKQHKKWQYAEGILKAWFNRNVRSLADVQALDNEFENRNGGGTNGGKIYQYQRGNGRPGSKSAEEALREAAESRKAWGG